MLTISDISRLDFVELVLAGVETLALGPSFGDISRLGPVVRVHETVDVGAGIAQTTLETRKGV